MKIKRLFSLIIFFVVVFVSTACGNGKQDVTPDSSDAFTFAIAWTDEPEAYSIQCMNLTAKELGENYKTLDMVCSFDLVYDDSSIRLKVRVSDKVRDSFLCGNLLDSIKKNIYLIIVFL